ncbi:uncharacterized protein BcabD6B2_23320 [Babesia caballi]|uniref:RAP domain-containing protein n=1 Tax=Babesia caballi TaxID=5871 RepID=A0AAV4LT09_BABCB|nr:hypothetical protein, conserved [Babesia caballi]
MTTTATRAAAPVLSDAAKLVSRVTQSAKLGETDVTVWRTYSREIVDMASTLEMPQVVKLLGSFSYMRYRHVGVLDALTTRVYESCFKLSSADIARVLRSYSILEHRNDFMFRLMLPEVAKRLDMFSLGHLTSVLYSYSNLGYYNRHLTDCVETLVIRNLHKVGPRELCKVLCALAKLHVRRRRLETVLGCHFCTTVELCSHADFSLMVNALGRLDFCGYPHLFSVVETEIYRKSKHLPSQSFSLVANAVSRREDSAKVIDFLAKQIPDRLREFDVHSLCLLSAAFSRRGAVRGELFERVAERVGLMSVSLYPRAVASLSFSYSRAGHLHGPLMYFAGQHLERFLAHYHCNEMAMILRAHTLLSVRNEQLLLAVARHICDYCPDMVPVRAADPLSEDRISFSMGYEGKGNAFGEVTHETAAAAAERGPHEGSPSEPLLPPPEPQDAELMHINHLEVFSADPFGTAQEGKHFLERGLMHSLLWIVQSFAVHGLWNETEVKGALQRVANEVACRPRELTPLTTAHLLYAYARLNYRLDNLLELLVRELRDPRTTFVFEQDHLRAAFHGLAAFGLDPASAGVHRVPTIELKRLMELHRHDVDRVVRAVLETDYEATAGMQASTELELDVPFAGTSTAAGTPASAGESAVTYVHIPSCVGAALGAGRGAGAFADRLRYNFAI